MSGSDKEMLGGPVRGSIGIPFKCCRLQLRV